MTKKYSSDKVMQKLFEGFRKSLTEAYGGDKVIHDIVVGIEKFMEVGSKITEDAYLDHMTQGYTGGGVHQSLTDLAAHLDNFGTEHQFTATLRADMEQLKNYVGTNNLDPNVEAFRALMEKVHNYIMEKFPSDIES